MAKLSIILILLSHISKRPWLKSCRIHDLSFDGECSNHTPLINVMPSETEIIRLKTLFATECLCVCLRARIIKIFQSPALALRWTLWAFAPVLVLKCADLLQQLGLDISASLPQAKANILPTRRRMRIVLSPTQKNVSLHFSCESI